MKTSTLLFLLVAITSTAFTQIRPGQYLLGGAVNFESTNEDYPINNSAKSNNFFISPSVGYFIVDNLAGGIRIDFSSYHTKTNSGESRSHTTTISPFVRYYILPVVKKVNAFIDVSYIRGRTKWTYDPNPSQYQKSRGYKISVGPSIFLTDQVALEFTLGFKHITSDSWGARNSNKFNTGLGLQIHLGKGRSKKAV